MGRALLGKSWGAGACGVQGSAGSWVGALPTYLSVGAFRDQARLQSEVGLRGCTSEKLGGSSLLVRTML